MSTANNNVRKCISILNSARNDSEKFAGLFIVTKTVSENDCDAASKKRLFEAIGGNFLTKLFTSTEVPNGCSVYSYKCLGLSILRCFCCDSELAVHPDMLAQVPPVLHFLESCIKNMNHEQTREAFNFLQAISLNKRGLDTLISSNAIDILCNVAVDQIFYKREILEMLVFLINYDCSNSFCCDPRLIHELLNNLSSQFRSDHNAEKFEMLDLLSTFISVCNYRKFASTASHHSWPQNVFEGLKDILRSCIDKPRRNSALRLAALSVEMLGPDWLASDVKEPKKYFLMYVHLCAIEVRLAIEDICFQEILPQSNLLVSCFIIIESAVYFMAVDNIDLQQNDILNVYRVLKHTFSNILALLREISLIVNRDNFSSEETSFVYGLVKVTIAWLTQETDFSQAEISNVMPFILSITNETFCNMTTTVRNTTTVDRSNLLRLMLPVMSQLVHNDRSRNLISSAKQMNVLYECTTYYWRIYTDSIHTSHSENVDFGDSKVALFYLCDILSNIVLLEPQEKLNKDTMESLVHFILDNIGNKNIIDEKDSVEGCLSILGLIIVEQHSEHLINNFEVCRCLQFVFRFLSSIHRINDSTKAIEVGSGYLEEWPDIIDLWQLGFNALNSLTKDNTWVVNRAIENGWSEEIIHVLNTVKAGHLPYNVRAQYEKLLCNLCVNSPSVLNEFKSTNGSKLCHKHKMSNLALLLNR